MRQDILFVTGNQVSGDSMIGYEKYVADIFDILKNGNNCSIVGLLRSGKTSLAMECIRRLEEMSEAYVVFRINLRDYTTYEEYLLGLMDAISDYLEYEGFFEVDIDDSGNKLYTWAEGSKALKTGVIPWKKLTKLVSVNPEKKKHTIKAVDSFKNELKAMFRFLHETLRKKIILLQDEFDNAGHIFTDCSCFEYLRNLATENATHIQLLIVSRRQIYMIERKSAGNSTFKGVLTSVPIQGFSDEDLKAYYSVLENEYEICLEEESKDTMEENCGRSPYLYSILGYHLANMKLNGEEVSLFSALAKSGQDIYDYHRTMLNNLADDRVAPSADDGSKAVVGENPSDRYSTLQLLTAIVIGPCLEITDDDEKALDSLGYLRSKKDEPQYYIACSERFTSYLHGQKVNTDSWKNLLELDHLIKFMIRKEQQRRTGEEYIPHERWMELLKKIGAEEILGTYEKFILDSLEDRGANQDILDVCSLDVAISFLEFEWELYRGYFGGKEFAAFSKQLRLCAVARNPLAHGHALSAMERVSVNTTCDELIPLLRNNHAEEMLQTELRRELVEAVSKVRTKYNSANGIVSAALQGKTVDFFPALPYKDKLRGFIDVDGTLYRAALPKRKFEERFPEVAMSNHLAKPYPVVVQKVELGQNSLTLDFAP